MNPGRRTVFLLALIGATAVLCGIVSGQKSGQHPRQQTLRRETFGMHPGPAKANWHTEVGYGAIRLWDAGVNWRHLEPAKGKFNWKKLDALVSKAEMNGLKVMLTLGQAPDWATGGKSSISAGKNYNARTPDRVQDYADYVRAVATRYRGRIEAYELWNEVNGSQFWTGTMPQMAALAQAGYRAVKAADPAALVLSPNVTPQGSDVRGALGKLFAAGAAQWCDVVSVHLYTPSVPEKKLEMVRGVREVMAAYGVQGKPIWNTEDTWSTWAPDPRRPVVQKAAMPAGRQADYVQRLYLVGALAGIERTYFYGPKPNHWSSVSLWDGRGNLTAAGQGLKTLIGHVVGRSVTGRESTATRQVLRLGDIGYAWNSETAGGLVRSTEQLPIAATLGSGQKVTRPPNALLPIRPTPLQLIYGPAKAQVEATKVQRGDLVYNTTFQHRDAGGAPTGWVSSLSVGNFAGVQPPHRHAITLRPTGDAYREFRQQLNEALRPGGTYRITIRYRLDATAENEWHLRIEAAEKAAGTAPNRLVTASLAATGRRWVTRTVEVTMPVSDADLRDTRIRLLNTRAATATRHPLHLAELDLVRLDGPGGAGGSR